MYTYMRVHESVLLLLLCMSPCVLSCRKVVSHSCACVSVDVCVDTRVYIYMSNSQKVKTKV